MCVDCVYLPYSNDVVMLVIAIATVLDDSGSSSDGGGGGGEMVMVVATDKHITLLFKTRSGIKHNAERCSDVSPRSAFCFGRLFLTTHAFRVSLFLEKRVLFFFLFLSFFSFPFFLLFPPFVPVRVLYDQ